MGIVSHTATPLPLTHLDTKDQQKNQPTPVAYKRLAITHPTVAANAMMLAKEAMLLHRLRHDNIARAMGMVYEEATAGVLVEYVSGGSLRTLLLENMGTPTRTMYTAADALRWCLDIARALTYCHSKGVLHRDVNPNNVMLTSTQWAVARAKVVDFGFHKQTTVAADDDGGSSGALPAAAQHTCPVGAILYMAPEVWRGQPYSTPADVFSWACVAYEVLTGTLRSAMLFADTATQQQLSQYAEKVAGGFREVVPGVVVAGGSVPDEVWSLVEQCWAPDAGKRPAMKDVVAVLEGYVEESGVVVTHHSDAWCVVM